MPPEVRNNQCPLCKRPLMGEPHPAARPIRLCFECQSMVEVIIPPGPVGIGTNAAATMNDTLQSFASVEVSAAEVAAAPTTGPLVEEQPAEAVSAPAITNPMAEREQSPTAPATTGGLSSKSADPWASPLPSYEYSEREWKGQLEPEPRRRMPGLLVLLVAVVLLGGAGYAAFKMGYADFGLVGLGEKEETVAAQTQPGVEDHGEATNASQAAAPAQEEPESGQAADGKTADTSETPQTVEGTIALQAASFPNGAGAREYADKLIKAGVPADIVEADLGRRGRWYRVKVGRFKTSEEALRFAARMRERARAAGIDLNLILSNYEGE